MGLTALSRRSSTKATQRGKVHNATDRMRGPSHLRPTDTRAERRSHRPAGSSTERPLAPAPRTRCPAPARGRHHRFQRIGLAPPAQHRVSARPAANVPASSCARVAAINAMASLALAIWEGDPLNLARPARGRRRDAGSAFARELGPATEFVVGRHRRPGGQREGS